MSKICEWCGNPLGQNYYDSADYRIKFCSKKCAIERYEKLGFPPEVKAPGCLSAIFSYLLVFAIIGGGIFLLSIFLKNQNSSSSTDSTSINYIVENVDSTVIGQEQSYIEQERPFVEGIGINFREINGHVLVNEIAIGSPINKYTNIAINDWLLAVSTRDDENWQDVNGDLQNVANLLKGKTGEKVGLRFYQNNPDSESYENEFHIVREKIYTDNLQFINQ